MAAEACKRIINNVAHAVTTALEWTLSQRVTPGPVQLEEPTRLRLLQALANIDMYSYGGQKLVDSHQVLATADLPFAPWPDGLSGIVAELVSLGVYTEEVWALLRHPRNPLVPVDLQPSTT